MSSPHLIPSNRSAGVLLHPTSLPSPFGIGDLGPSAYRWVDLLAGAGQSWWQLLPLGPTGYGDSPYQSFSTFAGNAYLVSPQLLIDDGLLTPDDCHGPTFPAHVVDYGAVIPFKTRLLDRAYERFTGPAGQRFRVDFEHFRAAEADWLADFSLYMALKDAHDGRPWTTWEPSLVLRDPAALDRARRDWSEGVERHAFRQWLFFRQWTALKKHANAKGVRIIGDVPIFVAGDSSDVWANPELFLLDADRRPRFVAGVPPDYFAATGQLWGNPLYDWDAIKATNYEWWIKRLRATLRQVDKVRLDHFRGFAAAWHVPAGMPTAEKGEWVPGPGADFLLAISEAFGGLPLIAEDLGEITPDVRELRLQFDLPGMRILQFGFDRPQNAFLPHNYDTNTVVYSGTHDNDTTRGWYFQAPAHEKALLKRYLPHVFDLSVAWDFIRLAWASVADYAIVPLQDILNLETWARMNMPGNPAGNWRWRYTPDQPVEAGLAELRSLTELYNRLPGSSQTVTG